MHNRHIGTSAIADDRREVGDRVEPRDSDQRRTDQDRARVPDQQRVSVRQATSPPARADRPRRAGPVVRDDALAEHSDSRCESARARMSLLTEPGTSGRIRRIGFVGYDCAMRALACDQARNRKGHTKRGVRDFDHVWSANTGGPADLICYTGRGYG